MGGGAEERREREREISFSPSAVREGCEPLSYISVRAVSAIDFHEVKIKRIISRTKTARFTSKRVFFCYVRKTRQSRRYIIADDIPQFFVQAH